MRVTPQCDSINTITICQNDSVQANPAVDFDGTNYVVLWNDNTVGLNRILAARVTPGGTVLDAGNHVGETDVDEVYPDIVYNGSNYLAVWCHYSDPYGVSGRFVSTQAQPSGSAITIATTETYKYITPRVAYSGHNYFVTWADMLPLTFNFNIYGQLIDADGSLVGDRVTIADESAPEIQPTIVFNGARFLVAWNDSGTIWGRYVDTLGQCQGPSFPISESTGRTRSNPWAIASDTNFLVIWEEDYTDQDIYGNVDLVIGIEENDGAITPVNPCFPTIIAGQLPLPAHGNYCIYDITGRQISTTRVQPGVYFLEIDGEITAKIVKVR